MTVHVPDLPDQVPAAFQGAAPAAPTADLHAWWTRFDDPLLSRLVDEGMRQNLGIAQARSRLREARRMTRGTDAAFLPTLGLSTHSTQEPSATDTFFQVSLDSIWELGLFGARDANRMQGEAGRAGATADWGEARVTVAAEIVREYVLMRAAQREAADHAEAARIDARAVDLAAIRVRARIAAPAQTASLRARAAASEAARIEATDRAAQAAQALAVLLGRTEADPAWLAPASPPRLASATVDAVPAELLRTRPEIRRAEAGVLAAAAEQGLARAALYPRVSLGATYLYSYNVTQRQPVRSNGLPMIGPIIDLPLFDWGRRQATADARGEALNGALLAYREQVVTAVGEAQAALNTLAAQGRRVAALEAGLRELDAEDAAQAVRARNGLASDYDGLALARTRIAAGTELAAARAAQSLAFVALYKSLGGAPLPGEAELP